MNLNKSSDEAILYELAKSLCYVYTFLIIFSLSRIFTYGFLPAMFLHIIIYLFSLLIFYKIKKLPYNFTASFYIISLFLLSVGAVIQNESIAHGSPLFICTIMMASILMSFRYAFATMVLSVTFNYFTLNLYSKDFYHISVIAPAVISLLLMHMSQKLKESLKKHIEITEKALKAKSEFLAVMSHEIRTPLNAILGMTTLLNDEKLSNDGRFYLNSIEKSGENLRSLINDILDYSKIEAGKYSLEKIVFNPSETISQACSLYKAMAKEKSLELIVNIDHELPDWIIGDPSRLTQVINNLLSNAIKFTKKGKIELTASFKELEENQFLFQICIKDNGIGISEEAKGILFQSFMQADSSTSREYGGTGLGLTICRGICESMGGEIWFTSELNKGTTFCFTFKAIKSEFSGTKNLFELSEDDLYLSKKKPLSILVADDNSMNQVIARKFLARFGYQVDIVSNGNEVLEALRNKKYDAIFMDAQMPERDGYETTKLIRAQKNLIYQPWIIACTASAGEEDKEKCLSFGMDDFVSKPVSLKSFKKAIINIDTKKR